MPFTIAIGATNGIARLWKTLTLNGIEYSFFEDSNFGIDSSASDFPIFVDEHIKYSDTEHSVTRISDDHGIDAPGVIVDRCRIYPT